VQVVGENGHLIKAYDERYFMIQRRHARDNKGFAEKEKAGLPLLSDPTRRRRMPTASSTRRARQSLDVLHQQGRDDLAAIDKQVKRTRRRRHGGKLKDLKVPAARRGTASALGEADARASRLLPPVRPAPSSCR